MDEDEIKQARNPGKKASNENTGPEFLLSLKPETF